ncbi:hypothetical protein [Variovorax sp. Varisp62]|uniref:hypothetical protein n=1 Tax=Variovorax sp. Varisp62 TaxID=3243049 RepID=UPI0012FCAD10
MAGLSFSNLQQVESGVIVCDEAPLANAAAFTGEAMKKAARRPLSHQLSTTLLRRRR